MKFIIQQLADALAFWSVHGLCNISAPREKILVTRQNVFSVLGS